MKAHRFKTHLTSAEELYNRFADELAERIERRIDDICPINAGILPRANASWEHLERFRVEEKLKLMREWESKGRNLAFLKNYSTESWGELMEKQFHLNKK